MTAAGSGSSTEKNLAGKIGNALTFCEETGYKACSVELQNVDTGNNEVLDISTGKFSDKENDVSDPVDKIHSSLYVKDKYSISDQAFHELSAISSDLPKSCQVKKLTQKMNLKFKIEPSPNGVLGVQQSLRACVTVCLTRLIEKAAQDGRDIPSTVKI